MTSPTVMELRSPRAIRERCQRILTAGLSGQLKHFEVDLGKLDDVAKLTVEVTRRRYPDLKIPPHSRFAHFDAGGVQRVAELHKQVAHHTPLEQARILTDVVVTSVLLDAGAGMAYRYREAETGLEIGRSEGLALASLDWVKAGGLSANGKAGEVDAAGLGAVTTDKLAEAFQVSATNPLVGMDGRVHLLRALGAALTERKDVFGPEARLGKLVDHLAQRAQGGVLRGEDVLLVLLDSLGPIWPSRLQLDGEPLGDVWPHPFAGGEGKGKGLVPFHKLSQWLTYSLLHPLEVAGLKVVELDGLTGLAEYRNGGLFVDAGVLLPRTPSLLSEPQTASSEAIVEWRALTVALLDRVAPLVRAELSLSPAQLPLASVLEGGTWAAGRELAKRLRADGGPPIQIISDGTVF